MYLTGSYLTFQLAGTYFLANINLISNVLSSQEIIEEKTDDMGHLVGLTIWEGKKVPVFDLRTLVGLPPSSIKYRPWIIITTPTIKDKLLKIAFLIDEAQDVIDIHLSEFKERKQQDERLKPDYLNGISTTGDIEYILIDLESLIEGELKDYLSAP